MPAERVVRVLPDVAAVGKAFDYTVPSHLAERVRIGTQVRVVLHGRRVGGWVVEDDVVPTQGVVLRPIDSVRGWGPPASVVSLSDWAAWRWAGPRSGFLKTGSSLRVASSLPGRRSSGTGDSSSRTHGTGPRSRPPPGSPLSGGTVVVRMPPAADPLPLLSDAAGLLTGADERAGVLVLAPDHDQAGLAAARISRTGVPVALLPGDWSKARAGGCVAVGSRAAAFAPLPRLAAAVVLDAHDEAYHEERAPTWCAWKVVAERAKRDGAPCALVSPCPTLDVLDAGRLLTPPRQAEREGWPAIETVDRRRDDPRTGLFSDRLVALVRWAVSGTDRHVLCVLNRTGRVRLLACATCREIARCDNCSGALESIAGDPGRVGSGPARPAAGDRLRCRRCGCERPVVCARCGGARMRSLRVGVTRAREELEALAGARVDEVWGPQDRAGAAVPTASVVIGTEAVLHRVGKADAIAFLDFDSELLAPRMRAGEEALALLARASRLVCGSSSFREATPGRSPGRVLVQTRMPDHDVLTAATSADPGRLVDGEASVRRALRLPPFSALAVVSGAASDVYGNRLREAAPPEVDVTGPVDGKWFVRSPGHSELCDLLAAVKRPQGRLRVEVDPVRV